MLLFASLFLAASSASASTVVLGDDAALGLEPLWATDLGPAYSRVTAGEESVLTHFSDGAEDYLVCLEPADGKERWRLAMGPIYRGHDGSEDGPISTPAASGGRAFALGPKGRFVAVDLSNGELLWSVDFVQELGAVEPEYGFTATPLCHGSNVIVQVGGSEERNLCALDAATGEMRWSMGTGAAGYRSPALLELAGREQLVVLNGGEILGVAPEDGTLLWRHALGAGGGAGMGRAGAIDDSRFHAYVGGSLAVFEVRQADGGFEVEETMRTRELGGTYSQPVHHEGYLYGFRSSFLTCVDVASGRRVWKSRPPGGNGLVLFGDRLIVYGADGNLVVVRASPEGYVEESRSQVLEHSGYAWPTLAGERVFLRNADQAVCVGLGGAEAKTITAAAGGFGDHAFGAFLGELAGVEESAPLLDTFFEEQASFPLIEGNLVHFVFRGDAEDVAVIGSMTGGSKADPLQRVPGTDLFHRTYTIEPGARWDYAYQVDFGRPTVDPLNERSVPGLRGMMSEVVTDGYQAPDHIQPSADGAKGRVESFEFASELLQNSRELSVYLPAGYDEGSAAYPLLLIHDGPTWIESGRMVDTLDNLIGRSVRPAIAVFIAPQREWWFESGGSRTEEYIDALADEFVPMLAERYRLTSNAKERVLHGVRGFALTAALGVVRRPEVFGRAALQSVSLEDVARHAFFDGLIARAPQGARFYVDWNRYEAHNADRGYDYALYGPRVLESLRDAGCVVIGGEKLDSHGWAGWRARTDDWLEAFLPME